MRELIIDPEFRGKIPPLSAEEFSKLEENILSDGEVREPLVCWNNTIVDGHHRWKIIQKHPEIPYKIKQMEFADKWAAIAWMCSNQLGRRNLTNEQKTYLLGKQYEAQKMTAGGDRKSSAQNEHLKSGRTAEVIAKEHNIGKETVKRAEHFAKGLDEAEQISPGIREAVLAGEVSAPKSVISKIRKMPQEQKERVVEAIEEKTKPAILRNIAREQPYKPTPVTTPDELRLEYDVDDFKQELDLMVKDMDKGFKLLLTMAHKEMLNYEAGYEAALAALNDARAVITRYEDFVKEAFGA